MNSPSKRQKIALTIMLSIYTAIGLILSLLSGIYGGPQDVILTITIFTSVLVPVSALITILFSPSSVLRTYADAEANGLEECNCQQRLRVGSEGPGFTADRSIFIIGQPTWEQSIRIDGDGVQIGDTTRYEFSKTNLSKPVD